MSSKKHSSSSSSSSKRRREEHSEDESRHRSSKHHHSSSSKNKLHDDHSDDERKSKLPADLIATIKDISEDDYFEKATEFRLWLKESKHKYLDEISSKESHRYFRKFVNKWNDYELEAKFYKGLNSTALDPSDTTRYKWSFAKNVNKMELDSIRDSVDSMTAQSRGDDKLKRRAAAGPTMPDTLAKEERYEEMRAQRKQEAKRGKERREQALDEVAPRETGREAQLAKKRALNAYHKRERSPDVELSEADLMGGDNFKARLAQERKTKEAREARQSERREQRLAPIMDKMDQYKAKESATMDMFRKMAEEQRKKREGF